MRRLGWGLVVLWLGAATSAALGQSPRYRVGSDNGLLSNLFGSSPKPDEKAKPKEDDDKEPAAKPASRPARPLARDHDRLMKAYFRREAVCDRLQEIALETGDEKLREEAERLLERARTLYKERANLLQRAAAAQEADKADKKTSRAAATRPTPGRPRPGDLKPQAPDRSTGERGDEP
jgi:hypothetical protein